MKHVFVIEVETSDGPKLVGPWYASKEVAKSWVHFVKAFYRGARTRTRKFTRKRAEQIQANGGQLQPYYGDNQPEGK